MHTLNRAGIFLLLFFSLAVTRQPVCLGEKESSILQGEFPTKVEILKYFLTVFRPSKKSAQRPLVFLLHGRGQKGGDYLKIWKEEADRRGYLLLAPTWQYGYRGSSQDLEGFYELLGEIIQKYPVNREKVYLAGISSGALVGRWLLLERPSVWKAVVLTASPPYDGWANPSRLEGLPPVLLVHGARDNQFHFGEAVRRVKILREQGVRADLLGYLNAGHEQRPEWSKDIFDWMEKNSGGQS